MEDTLGENLVNTESFKAVTVLILVLMEDTLGDKSTSRHEANL